MSEHRARDPRLLPPNRRETDQGLRVALVEDDASHALLAAEALEERGHRVVQYVTAQAAVAAACTERWDCIVLDYRLPDRTGLEAIAEFRRLPDPAPVVMVTASGSESIAVSALKSGASDYVVKTGSHGMELARAVELAAAKHRMEQMAKLHQREVEKRANTDALTGLLNRHRLADVLKAVADRARDRGEPYAVAMADVNGFKRINDAYGHAGGDSILQEVARHLAAVVREEDIVARYGGDEFVVVMAGATRASYRALEERLSAALASSPVAARLGLRLSVSLGIADDSDGDPEDVLRAADQAMYRRKRRARRLQRRG